MAKSKVSRSLLPALVSVVRFAGTVLLTKNACLEDWQLMKVGHLH